MSALERISHRFLKLIKQKWQARLCMQLRILSLLYSNETLSSCVQPNTTNRNFSRLDLIAHNQSAHANLDLC